LAAGSYNGGSIRESDGDTCKSVIYVSSMNVKYAGGAQGGVKIAVRDVPSHHSFMAEEYASALTTETMEPRATKAEVATDKSFMVYDNKKECIGDKKEEKPNEK
jgi:hypothetical protein